MHGREALRQFLTQVNSGCEIIGLTEDSVFINGKSAAVKWTGKGRNGKPVEGIDVIECIDAGKIVSVHADWDPAPVMAIIQS